MPTAASRLAATLTIAAAAIAGLPAAVSASPIDGLADAAEDLVDAVEAAARTTYVSCTAGADTNDGRTMATAKRSLPAANALELEPGDSLRFERGCTWYGTLDADWHGTAEQPITIGAYGVGDRPLIRNAPGQLANRFHHDVLVTGSHLVFDSIATTIDGAPTDPGCADHPIGFYVGFNFRDTGHHPDAADHNVLRNVHASGATAGAHLGPGADDNEVVGSTFVDNHVMERLTPIAVGALDDIGAWGILLRGDRNLIHENTFQANTAWCTYDTPPQGNAVEIYEGDDNQIVRNRSIDDRHFSELGGSAGNRAERNRFAHNVVTSSWPDATFVIARGPDDGWGPTTDTQVVHNTIHYSGARSEGIVCGAGCDESVLSLRGNIVWAEHKAVFADGPIDEAHNVFWAADGTPFLQLMSQQRSGTSRIANPAFVDADGGDVALRSTSPAIDAGDPTMVGTDHDGTAIPHGDAADAGALEFTGEATTGAATYHVDCRDGRDADDGRTPETAWRSLSVANAVDLQPGDALRFRRGCTWYGTLDARWHGDADQPVTIGAYGDPADPAPTFTNGPGALDDRYHANVQVSGSHLVLEDLATYIHGAPTDPNCANQPVGFYVGFNLIDTGDHPDSGSHNVLRRIDTRQQTIGVHLKTGADRNVIEHSRIRANEVMHVLTPGGNDDAGAWGMLVRSAGNEIRYNEFLNNNARCTYDTAPQGNSIEIFEGRDNVIRHNRSTNDRWFVGISGSASTAASGNQLRYNQFVSHRHDARFLIVRGPGHQGGATAGTVADHNTARLTGAAGQGIICGQGCSADVLRARNNIVVAEAKAIFADGAFDERGNLYWSSDGDPTVQFLGFAMDPSSMVADPRFVDPANNNLALRADSPAVDSAVDTGDDHDGHDVWGNPVPAGAGPDRGANERP